MRAPEGEEGSRRNLSSQDGLKGGGNRWLLQVGGEVGREGEEVPPILAPGDVPVGAGLPEALQGMEQGEEEDTLMQPHAANAQGW